MQNLAKDGSYYWVLAHVTPMYDGRGTIVGYHSSRRCPEKAAVAEVDAVYDLMRIEERRHPTAAWAPRRASRWWGKCWRARA